VMDTLSALVFHNLFGRFPNIRVVSVENGSGWVSYLLKVMDKMGGMGINGPWIGGRIPHRPSTVFKQHVFVSPFFEDEIEDLVACIGDDHVVFGSDFPHPEGLAEPMSFLKEIPNLPADSVRRIMRDNGRALVGRA
jgi:predicted TIM-barrel fold metal-dependent hydrolase